MSLTRPWMEGVFKYRGADKFVYTFNYRSRNRHRNLCDRQCVSPDDPLIVLDTYMNYTLLYDLLLKFLLMGCARFIYLYCMMGKEMTYDGLPFPGTGYPVPDVTNIYLIWTIQCMVLQLSTSLGCFRPWTFFWKPDWTRYQGLPLYHIYISNSG